MGYIPEDGDGKIDTDNHAEIPEMTFLLAKGVKGIVVYDAIEERPKDKSREYAEDILGIEYFELYLLQGVEHKETCEHDEKGHIPTGECIYSQALIEPSGAWSHLIMGDERT